MQTLYPHPSHYPLLAQLACAWCLYLYFHCFRQSDCLASWVCGLQQLGPHETRNKLCWLQPGQSQNSNSAGTSPGSSDLCVCDVTSGRPRPVPRTAPRRGSAGRRCLARAGRGYGEIRGPGTATPPCQDPAFSAFLSPTATDFSKFEWFFLWRNPVPKACVHLWMTSHRQGIIQDRGSETAFIGRWDIKDAVSLMSVCTRKEFFGNTIDDI